MPQVPDYLARITSEHQKPKFKAMVALKAQGMVDTQNLLALFPMLFDLRWAVGEQLEFDGAWVGVARNGLIDDDYRVAIQAQIAVNHWDRTVPGIYSIWSTVFGGAVKALVTDGQDMTMFITFTQQNFSDIIKTLLRAGQFAMCPAAVKMLGYYQPYDAGEPLFGLDVENPVPGGIAGLDVGYFIVPL